MKKELLIILCLFLSINNFYSQTNWELLNPKPTANTGKKIEFISENIGYIITTSELLETLDAGESWQKKQDISSGNDMSFYDSNGYIVGNDGYVLRSTNSGNSWTQISTNFNNSFNTVNIIDEDNIILSSSNSIVISSDGGNTWQSLNIPNVSVNKTFFVNASIGHAACDNGTLLKTVDGGQSWYVTQSTNLYPSDFFNIYFVNENIGFSTREHSDMYKTTDGGETWIKLAGISDAIYSIYFLNENMGYVTGYQGVIFKTTDGGNTWTWAGFQNGRFDGTSMFGIYFEDNNIGYATGVRGRIIKTTDGGNTWSEHSPTYSTFNEIKVFESGIGFARSSNGYFKTTDYGNSWVFASAVDHYSFCSGSFFINENVGYSIGNGSVEDLFKTTDGGVSWNKLYDPENNMDGLNEVFFIDENNGFISGGFNTRKILKTTDGGITWFEVLDQNVGKIQFINSQIGYAHRLGSSIGTMYKTIDGGNTWNINIEVDEEINDFHFVDENNGYFVGDQGLMYKTNNGGTTWKPLEIPYDWYTLVKFYSKNVGYIADEDGQLYRTMNGGESWELLTTQSRISSIELVDDTIFTAGSYGKIYRSDVEFDAVALHVNPAENISNSSVKLTGNVTSNQGEISNIQLEYSRFYDFTNSISTSPSSITANESLNLSIDIRSLNPNTRYYFRIKSTSNTIEYTSEILSFTTLLDYEITTFLTNNYSTKTAVIYGRIVSNEYDITNIEFEYGTSADALNTRVNGSPILVLGNTTQESGASLDNLEPDTEYFYRIKANHQGEDIYGDVVSFTTSPEYKITLYYPNINGSDATLSAKVRSYNQDITDLVFEYGTIDYENSVAASPSQVDANHLAYIDGAISNLDENSIYYYRLKGIHNGEVIYSEERVFNLSGNIIMVSGTIEETETNTLELKGIIHNYGATLTDIQFEYGITDSFGSSIVGTPNFVRFYDTYLIKSTINIPLSNQTYYYRLVATNNGNKIYSSTYQYTSGTLGVNDFSGDEQISIYPNPTAGFINIKLKNHEIVNLIEVYDITGKLVYFKNILNSVGGIRIDMTNLEKTIYILKVNLENNKIIYKKLILN